MATNRPASDVDLVIYGSTTEKQIDRIWTAFDESSLAIRVDVLGYDLLRHAGLKRHIDAVMLPLFTRADLLS